MGSFLGEGAADTLSKEDSTQIGEWAGPSLHSEVGPDALDLAACSFLRSSQLGSHTQNAALGGRGPEFLLRPRDWESQGESRWG